MALSIKNDEADRLARQLIELTGETLTEAVAVSLAERLERKRAQTDQRPLRERLNAISQHFLKLPVLDPRSPDAIVGYDEHGLPSP